MSSQHRDASDPIPRATTEVEEVSDGRVVGMDTGFTGGTELGVDAVNPDTERGFEMTTTLRLVCVAGLDRGRTFPVRSGALEIGRNPALDIELRAPDVSRRHARLIHADHGYVVEDLGSSGGTYVNGERVRKGMRISIGDRIQIGPSTVLVFTFHDELEARMRTLDKLESIASVVAGLAHDFKNALMVIEGNLDYIGEQVPQTTDNVAALDDIKRAAASATSLAKQLMSLGRNDEQPRAPLDLGAVITETLAMARRVTPDRIAFTPRIPPNLVVRGSREDLQRVFLNLLVNARDAIPATGTVVIEADVVRLSRTQAVTRQLDASGEYVLISVSDTGTGMDEATLAHVFEPFFTTKPAGVGTGLGLATVHAAVRRHRGSIAVDSVVGKGTTFRIWLPRV